MPLGNSFYDAVAGALSRGDLNLPTLPDVALKVDRMCQQDDVSAAALAGVIGKDPAIAVRLMRVANSAAFAGSQRVDNLYQAIVRVGFSITRRMVSALAMEQMFDSDTPWLKDMLRKNWARSVEVAACSQALAQHYTRLNPAIAMLAGLMHDVGVLPIVRLAETQPQLRREQIEEVIITSGPSIGWLLLRAWEFPPELVEVPGNCLDLTREHEGPADYVDLVAVAILYSGNSGQGAAASTATALTKLGVESIAALAAVEVLQASIAEARAVFKA